MPEAIGQYMVAELAPRQPASGKTKRWLIRNRDGELLGSISWHAPWRQYCLFVVGLPLFAAGCLRDLCEFIERQNAAQKAARK